MLRIFRCKLQELTAESANYIQNATDWEKEINSQLGVDYSTLIAIPKIDGEYVNFYTQRSGEFAPLAKDSTEFTNANKLLEERREKIIKFLESDKPLFNKTLENQRKAFSNLVATSDRNFVVQKTIPVSCPIKLSDTTYYDKQAKILEEAKLKEASIVPPIPPVPPKKRGCLLPFLLLLLLLLLLLGLLWWFFLRPWPFEDKKDVIQEPVVAQEVKEEPKVEEPVKEEPKVEEPVKEEPVVEEPVKEEPKVVEPVKEEPKVEKPVKKETPKVEKPKVEKPKTPKKDLNAKAVPKCKTLKQEGKMPKMAIAIDGSGSMSWPISGMGGPIRMDAAKVASSKILDVVDKNVDIGLVQIQTCSVAFNRGFYSSSQRSTLKNNIMSIRPDGGTPLVSGLNTMAKMLGNEANSVGILISDGEDSCPFTENMDICAVAKNIHSKYPNLTIHAVLIGEESYKASCVATITGGKVYKPTAADQIQVQLKEAASTMKKVCEE